MPWWFWWLVADFFGFLAGGLWIKLESTRAMSWWESCYELRKVRKRNILEKSFWLFFILGVCFVPLIVTILLIALGVILVILFIAGIVFYFLLAVALLGAIESLFAPKIKFTGPA